MLRYFCFWFKKSQVPAKLQSHEFENRNNASMCQPPYAFVLLVNPKFIAYINAKNITEDSLKLVEDVLRLTVVHYFNPSPF